MTRVLSSACVVLWLLCSGGGAWAGGGKPPIAILGLEVYDNGSGIDPETTQAAKDLTAALRNRVKAGTGPYAPVPGGEKELIDEKLLNNCDTEAPTCMAQIGAGLGADALMYGKIEKSAQNGQAIYKVSIKLLNVNRKQLASSTVETLTLADSSGPRASMHAKAWYAKLAGGSSGGTVVVKANIDRGMVMLDDDVKGNLASGTLTIGGVAEGRHTLAIEAKDYQRYETSITVHNNETLPHSATMVEMRPRTATPSREPLSVEGTVTARSSRNVWKPVFYGTAVLEVAAIGLTVYSWRQEVNEGNQIRLPGTTSKFSNSDCGTENRPTAEQASALSHFNKACDAYKLNKIGWAATGVIGAAVIGSFIMAFIRDSGSTDTKAATGPHRKRRELAITPIVTPDGGGATVQFDW